PYPTRVYDLGHLKKIPLKKLFAKNFRNFRPSLTFSESVLKSLGDAEGAQYSKRNKAYIKHSVTYQVKTKQDVALSFLPDYAFGGKLNYYFPIKKNSNLTNFKKILSLKKQQLFKGEKNAKRPKIRNDNFKNASSHFNMTKDEDQQFLLRPY
ncbi:hypothetical protein BpHYR1_020986, partial [Brachionus plicatilis]